MLGHTNLLRPFRQTLERKLFDEKLIFESSAIPWARFVHARLLCTRGEGYRDTRFPWKSGEGSMDTGGPPYSRCGNTRCSVCEREFEGRLKTSIGQVPGTSTGTLRKNSQKLLKARSGKTRQLAVNARNFRTSYEGNRARDAIGWAGEKSCNELMDVASGRSDHVGERCPRRAIRGAGECRRSGVPAIIYTASFSKNQHLLRLAVVLHGGSGLRLYRDLRATLVRARLTLS
ncbi:hypothetical protein K0M31_008680 [Melipona bicolor]|uniref:Uncharacterized protein n=1 Tax=Melipona bicolor TaxID=60889 RepID=A0AA40KJT3_9HYME|nr:hypothetical protein K0M31_008680 [Melipona bicolor]